MTQRSEKDAAAGWGPGRSAVADDRDLISLRVRQRGSRARSGATSSRPVAGKRSRAAEGGSSDEEKEEGKAARPWSEAEVEALRFCLGLYDEEELEDDEEGYRGAAWNELRVAMQMEGYVRSVEDLQERALRLM